jgi:hypothetical protein
MDMSRVRILHRSHPCCKGSKYVATTSLNHYQAEQNIPSSGPHKIAITEKGLLKT